MELEIPEGCFGDESPSHRTKNQERESRKGMRRPNKMAQSFVHLTVHYLGKSVSSGSGPELTDRNPSQLKNNYCCCSFF